MKIRLEKIINLFFVSIVLGVGFSYSKIYLFHIILLVLLFFLSYLKIKNNFRHLFRKPPTNLHKFFYAMFFWYFLSLIWSENKFYAIEYLFYLINGISIILITVYFINTIDKQNKIFRILFYTFTFEAVISLLEIFTPFRWPISPFSNHVHLFGRRLGVNFNDTNIMQIISSIPTGFQWNPNNLAITFLIILPFFLNYNGLVVKFFGSLLIITIIIYTDSRGVLISCIFLLLLWSILRFKRFLIFVFLFIFFIVVLSFHSRNMIINKIFCSVDALKFYFSEESYQHTDSIGIRRALIKEGLKALKNSLYIGVGGGNSKTVAEKSKNPFIGEIKSMHNFWVEMLVEGGVFFTFLFFSWYFYIVINLYIIFKNSEIQNLKYYSESTLLSMVSFVPGAISASSAIYLLPMWLMFGFALITINNYKRYKYETFNACGP